MKSSIIKKLKMKKISLINKNLIDLFYIENDFYFSIIYHPNEPWWEPIENPSSHESVCRLSSKEIEESGLILLLRTSLQPREEIIKIFKNKENEHFLDNEIINRSELICKK